MYQMEQGCREIKAKNKHRNEGYGHGRQTAARNLDGRRGVLFRDIVWGAKSNPRGLIGKGNKSDNNKCR
jgi:hypothetical protein